MRNSLLHVEKVDVLVHINFGKIKYGEKAYPASVILTLMEAQET